MRPFATVGSICLAIGIGICLGLYGLAHSQPHRNIRGVAVASESLQTADRDRPLIEERPLPERPRRGIDRKPSVLLDRTVIALQDQPEPVRGRKEDRPGTASAPGSGTDADKEKKTLADVAQPAADGGKVLLVFEMINEVPTHWALRNYRFIEFGGKRFLEGISCSPTSEVDNWDEGLKVRVSIDAIEVLIEFDSLEQYREKMKQEAEQERST